MPAESASGIVTLPSSHSVDETVRRVKNALVQKSITLFAVIDHSGEAEKAGLRMPNTKLLIFGNPQAGTPIMLAAPSSAIDLPLKLLVAEDEKGIARVSYNSSEYLQNRHGIPAELAKVLALDTLATSASA